MKGFPHRALNKRGMTAFLDLRVSLVFEKSRIPQGIDKIWDRISYLRPSGQSGQLRMEICVCAHSIKKLKTADQKRGNDQRCIGVAKGVANQQPRPVAHR